MNPPSGAQGPLGTWPSDSLDWARKKNPEGRELSPEKKTLGGCPGACLGAPHGPRRTVGGDPNRSIGGLPLEGRGPRDGAALKHPDKPLPWHTPVHMGSWMQNNLPGRGGTGHGHGVPWYGRVIQAWMNPEWHPGRGRARSRPPCLALPHDRWKSLVGSPPVQPALPCSAWLPPWLVHGPRWWELPATPTTQGSWPTGQEVTRAAPLHSDRMPSLTLWSHMAGKGGCSRHTNLQGCGRVPRGTTSSSGVGGGCVGWPCCLSPGLCRCPWVRPSALPAPLCGTQPSYVTPCLPGDSTSTHTRPSLGQCPAQDTPIP